MSGHSKWSTIKRRKEAQDRKRGKEFSRLAQEIKMAVKEGKSGDPGQNPRLRLLLSKAREVNMSKDKVRAAIERGLGKGGEGEIYEGIYEGYGPGGIGLLLKVETDNKQRSIAEIKSLFDKYGGSLSGPGSVIFLFENDGKGGYTAKVSLPVEQEKKAVVRQFLAMLKGREDVVAVFSNAQFPV